MVQVHALHKVKHVGTDINAAVSVVAHVLHAQPLVQTTFVLKVAVLMIATVIAVTTWTTCNISVYSKDFNTDLASAQALVNSKVVGGSEPCYYDPNRVSTVAFSISYTVGSWVGFGFVALIMLIVLIYGTKIFICDRYFSHYPHAANIFIWFGVLLPFGLFLPLRIAARVDEGTKNDFLIVMLVCIVIGIVPLGIAKWKHRNDECDDSECVEKVVRITKPGAVIPGRVPGDYSSTQKLNEFSPQQYQPPNIPPPLQNGYRSADYPPSNGYSGQPDSSIVYQPPTIPPPGNYQPPTIPPPGNYQPPTIPPPGNYQPPPGVYQPPNGPPSDYSSPYPPAQNNGADFKRQY
ncbi:hypothetical protein HDV04_004295 [Boothiomyces sp. JEL0838]|nr:hypothetical protein HDV04_004295 [Boothiomyces sp. JEL0838]